MASIIAAVKEDIKPEIDNAAKECNSLIMYVDNLDRLIEQSHLELPRIIFIDLDFNDFKPIESLKKMRIDAELREVTKIAFNEDVKQEKREEAMLAGCQHILSKDEFLNQLPSILKKYSEHHMEGLFNAED